MEANNKQKHRKQRATKRSDQAATRMHARSSRRHVRKRRKIDRSYKYSTEITHKFKQRNEKIRQQEFTQARQLTDEIKQDIKKDRTEQKINNLKEKLWYDITRLRKGFLPNHSKIRNEHNVIVPSNKKAATIADYLEKKQWGNNQSKGTISQDKLFDTQANINLHPFKKRT